MPPRDDESLALFPTAPAAPRGAASGERRGPAPPAPLADRMRPRSLDEVVGQDELIGPGAPLRALVESDALPSLL
ncbi:MAG TPA: replication-associated recombination protein A, partial [Myxococcota bacterium]|nr:replication-associated recombination protein A [Myxococcota bacterium]